MKEIDVIIPAAGLATRMKPITNNMSKAMVPVNGKPVISWILDSLSNITNVHINKVYIVYKYDDLSNYIRSNESRNFDITLIEQYKNVNGPGGAIYSVLDKCLKSENPSVKHNILIWLGDTICLYDKFDFKRNFLATTKVNDTSRWCIVENSDNNYTKFLNKVVSKNYNKLSDALIGIYYINDVNVYDLCKNISNIDIELLVKKELEVSDILEYFSSYDIIDVNKEKTTWYDCGELDSYYETCSSLLNLASRSQTIIRTGKNPDVIVKTAAYNNQEIKDKLYHEYNWYESCTSYQKLYIPTILHKLLDGYEMSKCPGTTLSDMFIYENIHETTWKEILTRLFTIYTKNFGNLINASEIYNYTTPFKENALRNIVDDFYVKKSIDRLKHPIYNSLNLTIDFDFIKKFIVKTGKLILDNTLNYSYLYHPLHVGWGHKPHGDFHFGNILFEANSGKFTFLDPRGGDFSNGFTHGLYDIAKLYHDLYCEYFLILQNKQNFKEKLRLNLLEHFTKLCDNYGYDTLSAKRLATILVFTCLPFHKENKTRCINLATTAFNYMKQLDNKQ